MDDVDARTIGIAALDAASDVQITPDHIIVRYISDGVWIVEVTQRGEHEVHSATIANP